MTGTGKRLDDALAILGHVQQPQDGAADEVASIRQLATAPVEAALGGQPGEQVAVIAPVAQELGLHIPAPALAHQSQRQQLAVRAFRRGAGPPEQGRELLPDLIDDDIGPQAEVVEVAYHRAGLRGSWLVGKVLPSYPGGRSSAHDELA